MIRIVEVGPRDGLQNEATPIPTEAKAAFIRALVGAGLTEIEATSFVSPKWVPQLGDAAELWPLLPHDRAHFSALVPNMRGLERAMALGVNRVALFTAASDAFTLKNINMTVDQSLETFAAVIERFQEKSPPLRDGERTTPPGNGQSAVEGEFAGSRDGSAAQHVEQPANTRPTSPQGEALPERHIRAYVSTAFECPYSGRIEPETVLAVCRKLLALGVDELSLGDTIGVASPKEVKRLTEILLEEIPVEKIAYHFHDTRGTAVANVAAAMELGIEVFDSSAGGLGGCPYAPGAGGNLATEDLVHFLEREGMPTGVDSEKLARASLPILEILGRVPTTKAQVATLARCGPAA